MWSRVWGRDMMRNGGRDGGGLLGTRWMHVYIWRTVSCQSSRYEELLMCALTTWVIAQDPATV